MSNFMAQWSVDRTSKDTIQLATGILEAATTDGVQALALLACELFGANVAMSAESCHKVSILCSRGHSSAVLDFIKARIGYRKGDSSWQLAQSDAGQRFLGLAACLDGLGPWNGAGVLHELIRSTALDKRFVPSRQNLKQLVQALENKLALSGFAEDVVGWALFFGPHSCYPIDEQDIWHTSRAPPTFPTKMPPSKAVIDLTKALSQVGRVGVVQKIDISSSVDLAPWLVAYVKWSLGVPPVIIFSKSRTFGSENNPGVNLRVIRDTQEIRIEVYSQTEKLSDLVEDTGSTTEFRGMVSVASYGKAKLQQRFGHPKGPQYRACLQALPFGCYTTRKWLYSDDRRDDAPKLSKDDLERWQTRGIKIARGEIFPSLKHIAQILHQYIGGSEASPAPNIDKPSVSWLTDLNLVQIVQSQLRPLDRESTSHSDLETSFLQNISDCVADIMAISLFNSADPRGVQLRFGVDTPRRFNTWIYYLLMERESAPIIVDEIVDWAITILGHKTPERGLWAMTSRYDQTVYPQTFLTQTIQREGILTLECVPGVLFWENQQYDYVRVSESLITRPKDYVNVEDLGISFYKEESSVNERIKFPLKVPITPQDLFPGFELEWQVRQMDTHLEIGIVVPSYPSLPLRDPLRFLNAATLSLFIDCEHGRNASFAPQASNLYRTSPLHLEPHEFEEDKDTSISIVQCDGNEKARFFSLAYGVGAIIRMDACLKCCVQRADLVPDRLVIC
ncbi:MAG: hypothetical protein Q9172_000075 [Xanthocarpia lactea]